MSSTIQKAELKKNSPTGLRGFFQEHWQKVIAGLIWTSAIIAFRRYMVINDLSFVEATQQLAAFFTSPAGPLIYIIIYALRPLVLFPATLLTLVGGAIFGPVLGVLWVVLGSNSSAMVAYVVGRYFGKGLLSDEEESEGIIKRYAKRMRENSFETVMIMRFIFLPYDLVNYLSGFLRIDWKAYLLASALGSIPGTIAFVLFGASLDISQGITSPDINPWTLLVSLAMVVVSIGISRYMKKREGIE